ncbi:ankyrin repeat protein [Planoprotostelium fungivorum]|uniref:Ankyrin repeat protein n=1 Tax=Planoprotostelium fungivorum TaxID=1890364 RepID=A0A2P6NV60_9EUKA|nr:ankyrin repeat protein [Planoprotostelium fungivorum]
MKELTERPSKDYVVEYPKVLNDSSTKLKLFDQLCTEENWYRELYAQKRDSSILDDPHLNLIDVHATPSSFFNVYEEDEKEKAIPRLFSEGPTSTVEIPAFLRDDDPRKKVHITGEQKDTLKAISGLKPTATNSGSQSTIVDIKNFQRNFDVFTEGQFRQFNWDNVFAAGGSILAALSPLPDVAGKDNQSRRLYYQAKYDKSDIDLFIYGLDEEKANKKLEEIYHGIKETVPYNCICFRSKHAVSIVSQFPYRHIQIILRLYKSPAEVLMGFDVDACSVGYDGSKVWMTPRAHRALTHRYNTVDMERRSPSYEMRLFKYAQRGFSVLVPTLDRKRVDLQLLERRYDQLQGLARLLLLEALPTPEARQQWRNLVRERKGREAESFRRGSLMMDLTGEDSDDDEDSAEARSDYSSVFMPWDPEWPAERIRKLMYTKDMVLNSKWYDPSKGFHTHPCFFGTAAEILRDCCGHCPPVPEEHVDPDAPFVSGILTWVTVNPGAQYAQRGFSVLVPTLDRKRVDLQLLERRYDQLQGLARLLLLEALPTPEARQQWRNLVRERKGREAESFRRGSLMMDLTGEDSDDDEDSAEARSDYSSVFMPWDPEWPAERIRKLMYTKDMVLNSKWYDPSKGFHTHPCFFGTAAEILRDCCGHCPPVPEEHVDPDAPFVSGILTWVTVNPGAQAKIGSFHPITEGDWTEGAYALDDTEQIVKDISGDDVKALKKIFDEKDDEKKKEMLNSRDAVGRTPLMIAAFAGANKCTQFLLESGARVSARMTDGRTSLHIAATYGRTEFVRQTLEKFDLLEEESRAETEWYWRDDKGKWTKFDQKLYDIFEDSYSAGEKQCKVDDERYVDFSMDNQEILKVFKKNTVTHESEVIGMQRRYDDENKRRAVRRVELKPAAKKEKKPKKAEVKKVEEKKSAPKKEKKKPLKKGGKGKKGEDEEEDDPMDEEENEEEEEGEEENEEEEEGEEENEEEEGEDDEGEDGDFESIKSIVDARKKEAAENKEKNAYDYDKEEEDQLDLEATDWDEGKIPLITAIDFGHFDIAKMLWNALPDKRAHFRKLVVQNYQNENIKTPRLLSFVLKLVGSLFSDEDKNVRHQLIQSTLSSGHKKLFRVLVDYIKKYKDNKTPIYDRDMEPLICTAINISKDPLHFIQILVEDLGAKAIKMNDVKIVEYLIQNGADVNCIHNSFTPLDTCHHRRDRLQQKLKDHERLVEREGRIPSDEHQWYDQQMSFMRQRAYQLSVTDEKSWKHRVIKRLNESNRHDQDTSTVYNVQIREKRVRLAKRVTDGSIIERVREAEKKNKEIIKLLGKKAKAFVDLKLTDEDLVYQQNQRKAGKTAGKRQRSESSESEDEEEEEEAPKPKKAKTNTGKKGQRKDVAMEALLTKKKKTLRLELINTHKNKQPYLVTTDDKDGKSFDDFQEAKEEFQDRFLVLTGLYWKDRGLLEETGEYKWSFDQPLIRQSKEPFQLSVTYPWSSKFKISEEDQKKYESLFEAIVKGDVAAVEELTIKKPIGQQLHVMAFIQDPTSSRVSPLLLASDAPMLKKFTPLNVEEASPAKKAALNNFDLSKLSSMRPGDYLNSKGEKKGKKGKKNAAGEYQINCDVNPKEALDDNLIRFTLKDSKNVEMFKAILDAKTDNERWLHQIFKRHPLTYAVQNKNKEAIDLIIEYSTKIPIVEKVEQYEGLDVAGKKSQWASEYQGAQKEVVKENPILMALDNKQLEMAQHLFDKYTKKGHKDNDGGWVIQLQWDNIGKGIIDRFVQTANTEERRTFLSQLIDEDEKRKTEFLDKVDKGEYPLLRTARSSDSKTFDLLVEKGDEKSQPLIHTALQNDVKMLDSVLKASGSKIIKQKDSEGRSALTVAAQQGQILHLHALLSDGTIDINDRDAEGFTALENAAMSTHADTFALLLKKTKEEEQSRENNVGMLLFDYSLQNETHDEDKEEVEDKMEEEEEEEEKEEEEEEEGKTLERLDSDQDGWGYNGHCLQTDNIQVVLDPKDEKEKKSREEAKKEEEEREKRTEKVKKEVEEAKKNKLKLPENREFVTRDSFAKVFQRFQTRRMEEEKKRQEQAEEEVADKMVE